MAEQTWTACTSYMKNLTAIKMKTLTNQKSAEYRHFMFNHPDPETRMHREQSLMGMAAARYLLAQAKIGINHFYSSEWLK